MNDKTAHEQLQPSEAIDVMKDTGGHLVIRYTENKRVSEMRYNVATKQFEHIVVFEEEDGDEISSYEKLSESLTASLLSSALTADKISTDVVTFDESKFDLATSFPEQV